MATKATKSPQRASQAVSDAVVVRAPKPTSKGMAPPDIEVEVSRNGKDLEGITPDLAERYEFARRCFDLRAAGATYRQIAQATGRSVSTVYEAMHTYLNQVHIESATGYRIIMVERLHTMLMVEWPAVKDINHERHYQAANVVFGIHDRLVRLLQMEGMDPLGDVDATNDPESGLKPTEMVVGLTRDEYFAALDRVVAKQREEEAALEAEEVEEAETVGEQDDQDADDE